VEGQENKENKETKETCVQNNYTTVHKPEAANQYQNSHKNNTKE